MRIRGLMAIPALLLVASLLQADESKSGDFLKADNWEGLKEYWKLEDGTVVGDSGKGINFNTFLCSKKKYKDFELKFHVRLKNGNGNSGIQIRSRIHDEKKLAVTGPQCDIGAGYWGSLYGENFGGMMKQAPAEEVNKKLKKDDFNAYHIKAVGKRVTITVNGVPCVDQEFEKLPEEGIIAFQLHGGGPMVVTFKEIEFKELN